MFLNSICFFCLYIWLSKFIDPLGCLGCLTTLLHIILGVLPGVGLVTEDVLQLVIPDHRDYLALHLHEVQGLDLVAVITTPLPNEDNIQGM